jgi:uncharacterized protein (DUF433 family)
MIKTFENKVQIGHGIYTVKDVSQILHMPYRKVNRWLTEYWDGELGSLYERQYSWKIEKTKAIGFHTLIEFYILILFAEAGVSTREVLKAHKELTKRYSSHFPFALKDVLENISTDGKKIYLHQDGTTLTLDGTKQLNLSFIKIFFKKLDFDNDLLASKFWPLGKNKKVVCDPTHKFGLPVVLGTNIQTEAIYRMYRANESKSFIAEIYNLSTSQVNDAIEFHSTAA